jgi:uncharacterized protein (TIGR02996 family)
VICYHTVMTDGDALLAAVIAHPDDDTPRLVYADWLQENGQPERAEFIRLQIERELGDANTIGYWDLRRRESTLLSKHRKEWGRPVRQLLPSSRYVFRRGFVEGVETEASLYLRSETELYAAAPLRDVVVRNVPNFVELSLRRRPQCVRLRAITSPGWGVHARVERDLLTMAPRQLEPHLATGRWLVIAWAIWSVPDRGAISQALTPRWPVRVALRPFDDFAEFKTWCDLPDNTASPLWLRLDNGKLTRYHARVNSPDEIAEFLSPD